MRLKKIRQLVKKILIWLHKVKWLNKFNQISCKQLNIVK